ncbi:TetR/AcrR family transcriptional regulator [Hugenholtzia roseola]|uniref:TetR/AcrR family transcriptional regulator n=1 Tax=Hugenholtzia roseola TaxID=1002 RepID=UPI00040A34AE|nr:TetR/AcrR family transcriptional regulator [Hugenholtzia roseola]
MTNSSDIWIEVGYNAFALEGFEGLKIERMAKRAGISKSSFYHHFADLEVFMAQLLAHHLAQMQHLAAQERVVQNIDPALVALLVAHKQDILFNRQLRICRHLPDFAQILQKTEAELGDTFVLVWVRELNLKLSPAQLRAFFELALENFFLQVNPQNFNTEWLRLYFQKLKTLAAHFA